MNTNVTKTQKTHLTNAQKTNKIKEETNNFD